MSPAGSLPCCIWAGSLRWYRPGSFELVWLADLDCSSSGPGILAEGFAEPPRQDLLPVYSAGQTSHLFWRDSQTWLCLPNALVEMWLPSSMRFLNLRGCRVCFVQGSRTRKNPSCHAYSISLNMNAALDGEYFGLTTGNLGSLD